MCRVSCCTPCVASLGCPKLFLSMNWNGKLLRFLEKRSLLTKWRKQSKYIKYTSIVYLRPCITQAIWTYNTIRWISVSTLYSKNVWIILWEVIEASYADRIISARSLSVKQKLHFRLHMNSWNSLLNKNKVTETPK
jgi:hypothetical protein